MRYVFVLSMLLVGAIVADEGRAQSEYVYMDRARSSLVRELTALGDWQTTHTTNQTVMQCTSCAAPVTVVLRMIEGYSKDTPFASAKALYLEGRKQQCQDLIARNAGRCIDTSNRGKGILSTSVEGTLEVQEYVTPQGPHLFAGYVEAGSGVPELPAMQAAMRHAVDRLNPLW